MSQILNLGIEFLYSETVSLFFFNSLFFEKLSNFPLNSSSFQVKISSKIFFSKGIFDNFFIFFLSTSFFISSNKVVGSDFPFFSEKNIGLGKIFSKNQFVIKKGKSFQF